MAIRPRVRFEVFQRDGFACRYCGRCPPGVVLHVDHVVPQSRGGSDHADNLLTACSECNLGKSAAAIPGIESEYPAELIETLTAALFELERASVDVLYNLVPETPEVDVHPMLKQWVDVMVKAAIVVRDHGHLPAGHDLEEMLDGWREFYRQVREGQV